MRTETNSQFSIRSIQELINQMQEYGNQPGNEDDIPMIAILIQEANKLITSWRKVIREIVETGKNNTQTFTAISEVRNWATIKASYLALYETFKEIETSC